MCIPAHVHMSTHTCNFKIIFEFLITAVKTVSTSRFLSIEDVTVFCTLVRMITGH